MARGGKLNGRRKEGVTGWNEGEERVALAEAWLVQCRATLDLQRRSAERRGARGPAPRRRNSERPDGFAHERGKAAPLAPPATRRPFCQGARDEAGPAEASLRPGQTGGKKPQRIWKRRGGGFVHALASSTTLPLKSWGPGRR